MNRCLDFEETLSAYLDGEASTSESLAVRGHLETCGACRELLAEWDRLSVAIEEPMGDLPERVLARVAPIPVVRRRGRSWAGKMLVAAALMAMAASGSVLAGKPGADRGSEPQAAAPATDVSPSAPPSVRPARPAEGGEPSVATTAPPAGASTKPVPVRPGQPPATRTSDGELALMMMVEHATVRPGDKVQVGFGLRNVSDATVKFAAHEESVFDLVVTDEKGTIVYRRSNGWSQTPKDRALEPNEQIEERFSFVAPGRPGGYLVHAECICFRGEMPRTAGDGLSTSKQEDGEWSKTGRMLVTPPVKLAVGSE